MRFHEWQIHERSQVSTTQREVLPLLDVASTNRVALVARQQSDGHGRQGREWSSPTGGLWCSLALRQSSPVDPFQTLLLALAARDSVAAAITGDASKLQLKWPNDLVTAPPAERKWGGILAGVSRTSAGEEWLIFGLGLNLDVPLAQLPQIGPEHLPATSIRAEFAESPSPESALLAILARFDELLVTDASGRPKTLSVVRTAMGTLGRRIAWEDLSAGTAAARCEGTAVDLAPDGALVVDQSGVRRELRAGDIRHLRSR